MTRRRTCAAGLLVLLGCGAPPEARPEGAPPSTVDVYQTPTSARAPTTATAPSAALPGCCKDYQEIERLDGQRVAIEGVYRRTAVMKRRSANDPEDAAADRAARTVEIRTGNASVMLEVYYREKGRRSESELARFDGRRVRVVGTLKRSTPEQFHGDIPMQTMIGPCVVDIESIELIADAR